MKVVTRHNVFSSSSFTTELFTGSVSCPQETLKSKAPREPQLAGTERDPGRFELVPFRRAKPRPGQPEERACLAVFP